MPRVRIDLTVASPATLPDVPDLLAGAAEVDITPPPGLPKAGYSRNAHDGTGFRTRLRARVVHLRHGRVSLAVVATDLLGGSAVVQHLVAERVAASTDVPLAGLFLGATHTHGAPGQFHGTDFYNRFSSNRAGFDPDWTAFLVDRVAAAVEQAVRDRRPARAGWGRTQVAGLTRNRSLAAYRRNPGAARENAATAVNPWLDLLRVDGTDGRPITALVTFSVHGTAVPMSARPYNADLWSYLCTRLGDRIHEQTGHRPVVGALQGTHGDVTPALEGAAGHPEAARIGHGIADAAADLYAGLADRLDGAPPLGAALQALDLRTGSGRAAGGVTLPARPAVGAALLAGAVENVTPGVSALPLLRPGQGKRWHRSRHGAKWVVGSRWGQALALPLESFPRVLPVQLLRIGPVLLTGLPMEITTTSGRRFARAVEEAHGDGVRAVVSSVADEYAGYCTTAEEYGAQFYEGGHTLYGPDTQRFLAASLEALSGRLAAAGPVVQDVAARTLELAVRRFPAPAPTGALVTSLGAVTGRRPGEWSWSWRGPVPVWHETVVTVEQDDGTGWRPVPQPGGRVLDDGHGDLEVVAVRGGYRVTWFTGPVELPGTEKAPRHRFRVRDAFSPSF